MVFSCLVDADYLATEQFMAPEQAALRPSGQPSISELRDRADSYIDRLAHEADQARPGAAVNAHRARVLSACREAARLEPGFFTLTVPTGGGKTLSSLAFALRHAESHGLNRVITAIPFTSIIEQNAAHIRAALGDLNGKLVLEHHSNLDPQQEKAQTQQNRLAAENWDAPVVVTTNVQLLESLFACRTGRCRKLHRIAHSVIVLDEAQALPPGLLAPTLAALRELVRNYGCTIVLCTATQPALEKRANFPIGIDQPRPIIPHGHREELFKGLKRVEVEQAGTLSDDQLVDRLASEDQVLCIVNTRPHAAELFTSLCERLGETNTVERQGLEVPAVGSCLHLSANMCPRHRSAVLRLIRRRLETGRPCRVISTQLVEAGVDVDFPVVYRATAGLDAIAQAAGRCNNIRGRVWACTALSSHPTRGAWIETDTGSVSATGPTQVAPHTGCVD
jgi:CRISPR-associated endonuclease/helicase Cas3